MDITTLVQLRDKRAGLLLNLKQETYRGYTQWNLYVTFELLDTLGKKPVPHTMCITSNRHSHSIKRQLDAAGLSYIETALQSAELSALSRPVTVRQTAPKTRCVPCGKSDFDCASGCHNPTVFSPCVGDWVCNLQVAQ
jgi:hypothetical protein